VTSFSAGTGRRLRFAAAGFALILLAGFLFVYVTRSHTENELATTTETNAMAPPPVDVVPVQAASDSRPLVLPGETAAWYESMIYARVSGYVAKWNVDIGDHVTKGETLASIDTPELDAQLAAAQAKLKAQQAEVNVREAEANFAQSTYERWRASPKGVVSEQEREDKKAGYAGAVAKLAAARAQVNLDQADIDRFTAFEQFKQVSAPYDGTITERHVDIGDLVNEGNSGGNKPLYRMVKDDPIRVFVDAPQGVAADLMKPGVPVEVTASNLPNRHFDGTITRTANAVDPRTRTFRVEIDIPNPHRDLVSGLYVEAGFKMANDGLLQVPAAALVFRAGGPEVATVGNDGTVAFHKVEIARDDGSTVELRSGVSPGEKVVLNISSQIADGQKVHVNDEIDHSAKTASALR